MFISLTAREKWAQSSDHSLYFTTLSGADCRRKSGLALIKYSLHESFVRRDPPQWFLRCVDGDGRRSAVTALKDCVHPALTSCFPGTNEETDRLRAASVDSITNAFMSWHYSCLSSVSFSLFVPVTCRTPSSHQMPSDFPSVPSDLNSSSSNSQFA